MGGHVDRRPALPEDERVWVPQGEVLRHHSGAYGPHTEFARVSAMKSFRRGEGLPGAVWSTRRPEVWQELGSHFVRAEVAKASGIDAAIGFPIFKGNEIAAVVVWRVEDTAQALFDVDDFEQFIANLERKKLSQASSMRVAVADAMRYSLEAGGKRFRPALVTGTHDALGGTSPDAAAQVVDRQPIVAVLGVLECERQQSRLLGFGPV